MSEETLLTRGSNVIKQSNAFEQKLAWVRERAAKAGAATIEEACPDVLAEFSNRSSRALAQLRRKALEAAIQTEKKVTIPRQSRGHSGCEPLKAAVRGR